VLSEDIMMRFPARLFVVPALLMTLSGCTDEAHHLSPSRTSFAGGKDRPGKRGMSVIVDMQSLLGKPYKTAKRELSRFRRTETLPVPGYETDPFYRGGYYYVFRIGPPRKAGELPRELAVTTSANGHVTRLTANNLEGVGDTLDSSDKALARFGIVGIGEPDRDASRGKGWDNWRNMSIGVTSAGDTRKVWQVQVAFAGH